MALTFQVVIDSHHPHELADWWAETLGWSAEPQDEAFIRSMIEQGLASEADTMRHRGALVWREGAAINPPEGGPRVLFQLTDEDKAGKNRMHLDLRDVPEDRTELYAGLVARGARELWRARQGPHEWVTFADPEGNEFCA
ncbi:VOC family protein [Segeticoccus rhizosphaerae]|jgi:hypothetical protein|uniref:VOC family protein n=1 Tax=Segeticoccus rhizosphaerae TaxID=1104777 RepID=UPI0010C11744|nr:MULTISPECIES: VOC family protein [Intrasporangiaceae]